MAKAAVHDFEGYTDSDFRAMLLVWIPTLQPNRSRHNALRLLAMAFRKTQNKVIHEEMAPMLCNSSAAVDILVEEMISIYDSFRTPEFTESLSLGACNIFTLFQSIAEHPDTKMHIFEAEIQIYIKPFLVTKSNERHLELVRISSLGIIGALMQAEDPVITSLILKSEMYPCFLMSMNYGSIYSKIIATSIVKKILKDETGFNYCCHVRERRWILMQCLATVTQQLAASGFAEYQRKRLLQHLIGCYHVLSTNPGTCEDLETCFPWLLRAAPFISVLNDDEESMQCLRQIYANITAGQQIRFRRRGQVEQDT